MSNDALNDSHRGECSHSRSVEKGRYCVIVFDVVGLTDPITFTVEVVQP